MSLTFSFFLLINVTSSIEASLTEKEISKSSEEQSLYFSFESNQMLKELDHQLEWLALYWKNFLENHEEDFKKSGEWVEISKNFDLKKKLLVELKNEYSNFLKTFALITFKIENPTARYPLLVLEDGQNQITKEFIKQIQVSLFPKGWEEMYEDYLKNESIKNSK